MAQMKQLRSILMAGCLLGFSVLAIATSAQAVTLDSGAPDTAAFPFGNSDTQTYGQTFNAPISGILTSFELSLNGTVGGNLYGGIGVWDTLTHGVSSILYQSANIASASGTFTYSFTPNVAVSAGQIYVAFLSVFGTNATTTTTMPLSTAQLDPNLLAFVYHNTFIGPTPGPNASNWEGEFGGADASFKATISPSSVPLPAALPLLLTGFGGLVAMGRRRKSKAI
jgi:hypothetical protein